MLIESYLQQWCLKARRWQQPRGKLMGAKVKNVLLHLPQLDLQLQD